MNDNFKIIYKILSTLEKDMDLQEFDIEKISFNTLGISKERWAKYIQMMVDSEYIKGIHVYSMNKPEVAEKIAENLSEIIGTKQR